jgi:hypothetical protein
MPLVTPLCVHTTPALASPALPAELEVKDSTSQPGPDLLGGACGGQGADELQQQEAGVAIEQAREGVAC